MVDTDRNDTADTTANDDQRDLSEGMTPASEQDASDTIAELHDALLKAQGEIDEARNALLYERAETQNVRRRAEKAAQEAQAYAATAFARDILSVADNLARALDAIPDALRGDDQWKGLVTGLEATGRELESVFGRHGITRIAAKGEPLDPNRHQAMLEIPSADAAPGTIVQEIKAGYVIRDRLLRPALVGVAKAAE